MYRQLLCEIAAAVAVFVWFIFTFSSCRTVEVPVETIKIEQVHDTLINVDSIYVSHVERVKGDSFYFFDTIYKYKVIDKKVEVLKVDSIPYTIEVVKEVHKRSAYDRFCSLAFWIIVVVVCGATALRIYIKVQLGR